MTDTRYRWSGRPVCVALVVMALALCANVLAQPAGTAGYGAAEQELVSIERDWCTALMRRDVTLLNRILAGEYIGVSSRGVVSTKAQEIVNLKGPDSIDTCVDRNVKVRVYGEAAVVTGVATRSGTYQGVPFKNRRGVWTDTFVKKDGRWQCVASHGTLVAEQQK